MALLKGEFTLRSGRKSKYYLDKYLFETQGDVLEALGKSFAEKVAAIESESGGVDRIAGAELGGIPIVTATAIYSGKPTVLIRNQKKDYGTAKQLEGKIEAGEKIVILEDVATTGGQVLEAAKLLEEEFGVKVVKIIATIDRQEGARENIEGAGYGFDALFTKSDLGIDE
ncbi:orotate phosphoribosyltransferase [Poriferisphaera sp. WC338]|uniref:orotate phosphoribosyltransferase n=1 Tax=Poriferisphaera sp. WC338 TaxID=3425129 RepID=UPI003D817630